MNHLAEHNEHHKYWSVAFNELALEEFYPHIANNIVRAGVQVTLANEVWLKFSLYQWKNGHFNSYVVENFLAKN